MLLVTPQAANKTIGQGGFQEVEQMAVFKDMVGYQEEVRDPSRTAEVLNRVITKARRLSAPAQINIPRDFWTQVIDVEIPEAIDFEVPSGGSDAIDEAAKLLSDAKFPVILNGAGVIWEEQLRLPKSLQKNSMHRFAVITNTMMPFQDPIRFMQVLLVTMDQKPGWN